MAASSVADRPLAIREAERIGVETNDLTKRFGRGSLLTRIAGRAAWREPVLALDGHDVVGDDVGVRRRAALVTADDRSFSMRLTDRENLDLFAGLHDAPAGAVA